MPDPQPTPPPHATNAIAGPSSSSSPAPHQQPPHSSSSASPGPSSVSASTTGGSSTSMTMPSIMTPQVQASILAGMTAQKFANVLAKAQHLKAAGWTEHTSEDLKSLISVLRLVQQAGLMNGGGGMNGGNGNGNGVANGENGGEQPTNASNPGTPASAPLPIPSPAPSTTPVPAPPSAPVPPRSDAHQANNMTPTQLSQLRTQVHAFKQLNRNMPLPAHIKDAVMGVQVGLVNGSGAQVAQGQGQVQVPGLDQVAMSMENKVVGKAVEVMMGLEKEREQIETSSGGRSPVTSGSTNGGSGESTPMSASKPIKRDPNAPPPYAREFDKDSIIYPYNAVQTLPSVYLQRPGPRIPFESSKFQRMIVPSLMPKGMDPYLMLEERNRHIDEKMALRERELMEMASTLGMGDAGAEEVAGLTNGSGNGQFKVEENDVGYNTLTGRPFAYDGHKLGRSQMRAIIELRGLRLRDKQKLMREEAVRDMNAASQLPSDRTEFRRFRAYAPRDARTIEDLERKQRLEREEAGRRKHVEYILGICEHGRSLKEASARAAAKSKRLADSVLAAHRYQEREEQKRIEKLSKERLKALKNDDEDGYRALIDQAKDTRITHLLKRTDAYLDSLVAQVSVQQKDVAAGGMPRTSTGPRITKGGMADGGESVVPGEEEERVDYLHMTHAIKEPVEKQADLLVGGTLKSYQIQGLEWMVSLYNNKLNGILADEMGLGKTIQTLSLVTYLIEKKKEMGPYLILVPLSTITNWTSEAQKWAPSVKTIVLKGDQKQRKILLDQIKRREFQVLLTTFEFVVREVGILAKIPWHHLIIDEGHRMKNAKSKLAQVLNEKYQTKYRLILTGTPLQNNIPELWNLLNFVLPKVFDSSKSFDDWFNAPFAGTGSENAEMTEEEKLLVVKGLHKVLRPFLLRRLKKDVESELPDKVEKIIKVKMSGLQLVEYRHIKQHGRLIEDQSEKKEKSKGTALHNVVIQLRKICQHPFIFGEISRDIYGDARDVWDDTIFRASGKFELLDRILPKFIARDHKVLIFFQWRETIQLFADYCAMKGIVYCRLDGHTKTDERQELLLTFNDANSPYKVFLLSTRAGGLGLNLQSADTVIIFDSDYNPHADLQAQDRAHRIGQKKEVRVFRLVCSGTVEEGIIEVAKKKLALDGQIIQAGKFDGHTTAEERDTFLRSLLAAGEGDLDQEDAEPDEESLNEMLARGPDEFDIFTKMDEERKARDAATSAPPRLMQETELPDYYQKKYEAEDYIDLDDEVKGRGARKKNQINYGEDTEEAFLSALYEGDDNDGSDITGGRRARTAKSTEPSTAAPSRLNSPAPSDAAPRAGRARKAVGRVGKKPIDSSEADPDSDAESEMPSVTTNRKRGRADSMSTAAEDEVKPAPKRPKANKTKSQLNPAVGVILRQAMTELWTGVYSNPSAVIFRDRVPNDTPHYYNIIQNPMWLGKIKQKIKNGYGDLSAFRADMIQIFDNARIYNDDGSPVYNLADQLQAEFDEEYDQKFRELGFNGPAGAAEDLDDGSSAGTPAAAGTTKVILRMPGATAAGHGARSKPKGGKGGVGKKAGPARAHRGGGGKRGQAASTESEEEDVAMENSDDSD